MRILIIDGQGGGIGARLVSLLRPRLPAGSPPSTVRARSVSWVPMWFISRLRHWGG